MKAGWRNCWWGVVAAMLGAAIVSSSLSLAAPPLPTQTGSPAPSQPVVATPDTPREPLLLSRDYRIGPDDLLDIQVFGVDPLSRNVRVNARGQISLPLIGLLDVGGLTAQEAEALIARRLGETYLQNPQVSLFVKEYTSQRVTVEGAVNKPGIYPLRGPTTLLQTLALAGGQGPLSNMQEVMLFRVDANGNRQSRVFDVEQIRDGKADDPAVLNDDVVVVKRSPKREALKDSIFRDILDTLNPLKW
jgi:polysaccharide export outer membrane protein